MSGREDESVDAEADAGPAGTQRLDKWLWFARVTKSRTLAAQLVQDGKVRVNRTRVAKPSHAVRSGDVLTIAVRGHVQVLRVIAPGTRRGPPPEARLLYEIVTAGGGGRPEQPSGPEREKGAGRPTKRDRRMADRLTESED
jgi:ribosome-associated heat shock protein Hsp15